MPAPLPVPSSRMSFPWLRAVSGRSFWLFFPAGTLLLLFLAFPLFGVLGYSFAQRGPYGGVDFSELSFQNYLRVFQPLYLKVFWNSLSLAFGVTALCLVLGYPLAYFLATAPRRWRSLGLTLLIVPFWTSFIVRVFALRLFLGEHGPVNRFFCALGFIQEPLSLLHTPFAIAFGMVTNFLPLMVLPLFVVLEKFDFSYLEAAQDLGASSARAFFQVLLPLTQSGIVAGCLFVLTPALGEFLIPDLLGGAKQVFLGNLITDQFLKTRDWPFGSTLTVVLMTWVWVSLWIYLRFHQKAEH